MESVDQEVPKDPSFSEFQGKHPIPFQLRQIMEQRANVWVQRLYDICCDAYKSRGKTLSLDFDRAVWFYRVEPFIMGETDSQIHSGTMGGFLNLLLCAVGSTPEKRPSLTVSQKQCCFDVRMKVYETWHDKLHHLPPRINEAIEALAQANARERRASRIVAGLPPDDCPPPPTTQAHPSRQPEELPLPISMADSTFWRDLADKFLALQDRLRAESKATDLTNRSFNVLAKRGASAIVGVPDVWVWLGAVMKEDTEFRSSYLDTEVSGKAELEQSLVMGDTDRFCQLSATFCKKLEGLAVQAEFEERRRSAGRSAPLSTFETTVGELMVQARKECPSKHLPQTEISKIAALLDNKNIPARGNLEREASRTMADYNQRHPTAAIKTWKAASCHPQFRRAVRKRFSRAEEKYKKATPSVAGPSAETLRTTI